MHHRGRSHELGLHVVVIIGFLATNTFAQGRERPSLDEWLRAASPQAEAQRDLWSKPDSVIVALRVHPGDVVADLGCGTGYWARRLAGAVGPSGRILALDVDPVVLEACRIATARDGVENIEMRLVQEDDPGLAGIQVDLVFMCNVWHILVDRIAYAEHMRRSLPANCRLAILTWDQKLPPKRSLSGARPDRFEVRRAAEAAGYALEAEYDFISKQHFLVFRPGEAEIHALLPNSRYVGAHLLIGARPDSMVPALRALKARGFMSVLDMTATSTAAAGQEALTIESGLRCLRLPLDPQGLQAAVVQEFIATVREGIVAVFADDPRVVAGLVAVLCERGMLNDFSDTENIQLEQWAGESIAAMRGVVDHALIDR